MNTRPIVYEFRGQLPNKRPKWLVVDWDDMLVYCPPKYEARCRKIIAAAKATFHASSIITVSSKVKAGLLEYIAEQPAPTGVGALKKFTLDALQRRHFSRKDAEQLMNINIKGAIADGILVRKGNRFSIDPEIGRTLLEQTAWMRNCRLLLANIKANMPQLEALRKEAVEGYVAIDRFYRYYHRSFKVYALQGETTRIVEALQNLMPGRELNPQFLEILGRGTGKVWKPSHNHHWHRHTGPILEAFFHARTMLELAISAGKELKYPPTCFPTNWGAVLYLFGLR